MKKNIIKAEQVSTNNKGQNIKFEELSKEELRQEINNLVKLLFADYRKAG